MLMDRRRIGPSLQPVASFERGGRDGEDSGIIIRLFGTTQPVAS